MKSHLNKREISLSVITVISLLLVIVTGAYAAHLRTENQNNSALLAGKNTILKKNAVDSNTTANYVDTICAEYRKLYQAYTTISAQNPPDNRTGYALPGAAKGEVDSCYQPD